MPVRWGLGVFNVLKALHRAIILWFDHFLDSGAEICQILYCFLENLKTSKRHSKIIWPFMYTSRDPNLLPILVVSLTNDLSTQSDNWKMKNNNLLNELNELKLYEVSRKKSNFRQMKFQLSILKNKKVLFPKKNFFWP